MPRERMRDSQRFQLLVEAPLVHEKLGCVARGRGGVESLEPFRTEAGVAEHVEIRDGEEHRTSADLATDLLQDGEILLVVQLVQVQHHAGRMDVPRLEDRLVGRAQPVHDNAGSAKIARHAKAAHGVIADDQGWRVRCCGKAYSTGYCHSASLRLPRLAPQATPKSYHIVRPAGV
ncbi:MAG TPA: hypothetical protein VGQ14_01100 [Candidatus Eisenbacteria bacterium]|nr:hypothetical protein [Candidatus Eisenbacteria bacterium]